MDVLTQFFASKGFLPHGYCFQWTSALLWTYVAADAVIALAYYSIPIALWTFVRRRVDLPFSWVFIMFAVFILACGTTHVMGIWNIWQPVYWLDAGIKAMTASISLATAALLWPLLPRALALPSPARLRAVNHELEQEVATRRRLEAELQALNNQLEQRVADRTSELAAANAELRRRDDEREQAARLLLEAQQLLEAVIDNSAAIIFVKDIEGRYRLVNRFFLELFHLEQAAVLGRTDHELFARDAADAFRAMDARVVAAGRALIEEEVDGPRTYLSVKSPLRDADHRLTGVLGISTDISDRKLAESRVAAQLDRLRLLDEITTAIANRRDLQSIYQVAVRSLEERLPVDFCCVCGYDPVDRALTVACVGNGSRALAQELAMSERAAIPIEANGLSRCVQGELVHEPDLTTVDFAFPQRLAGGGLRAVIFAPVQSESRLFGVLVAARRTVASFSGVDREFVRQLSAHVALAVRQAELHGALQQAYDELRESQQFVIQHERLRALGQMASGIAHDISNAISPAALYTENLLEHEPHLSERGRAMLGVILRAIDDVAATVSRMSEFYRQREPKFKLVPMALNPLVLEVIELTRARWSDMPQQRGVVIKVTTELASDLPSVLGIDSELREALTNLIFNAVDAMPDGGALTLRTRLGRPGGTGNLSGRAMLEVEDNGMGMDEATRQRCLEPFFTTKGERGTGLGLAMVYGVAQRHGADIEIESAVGRGTTVRLSLTTVDPRERVFSVAAPPPTPVRALRLLLVDDDPVVLQSFSDTLGRDGHEVTVAPGGAAGIEAFNSARQAGHPFDAVITDLGMPYIDGRQVASEVKARSPRTPVIMLTGWGRPTATGDGVPPHVDWILTKPPKMGEVRAVLGLVTLSPSHSAVGSEAERR